AVFRHFAHAKGHGQGGDDVLLGDQAAHAGGGGAPVAKAQGRKDGGDHPGDGGQQGGVGVLHGAEYPVGEAVALQEPQHHGGGQDDGAGPLDVGRAALPGGAQHVAPGGHVVGGQLHDEGGGVAGEGFGLFQDDAADDDGGDADEVSADGHQAAAAEDGAGQQADDGHLGAAGDKAGGHDGQLAVTVLLDGAAGHDAGDAAARGHQQGDEALARQAEPAEDAVHHEGDAGHVADVLQNGQQEAQDQDLGHKAQGRAHAGHD